MNYTFNRVELKEFISVFCLKIKTIDPEKIYLMEFYRDSQCWDRRLSALNHILSIILEQYAKKGVDHKEVIDFIYSLNESCNFVVQEGSIQFLDALMEDVSEENLSLEEQLVNAQNKIQL